MSLQIRAVTAAIASLSVPGLTIEDVDGIPVNAADAGLPALFPEPLSFITDLSARRDSFGLANEASWTVEYNLSYTYCYSPAGSGSMPFTAYPDMVELAIALAEAAVTTELAGVEITLLDMPAFGPVPDPLGNQYMGCRLRFHVMELLN